MGSSYILGIYSYDFYLSFSSLCFAFILSSTSLSAGSSNYSSKVTCRPMLTLLSSPLLRTSSTITCLLDFSSTVLLPFIITHTAPLDSPSSILPHYDFNFGCFLYLPLFFLLLLFFVKLFLPLVLYDQH